MYLDGYYHDNPPEGYVFASNYGEKFRDSGEPMCQMDVILRTSDFMGVPVEDVLVLPNNRPNVKWQAFIRRK